MCDGRETPSSAPSSDSFSERMERSKGVVSDARLERRWWLKERALDRSDASSPASSALKARLLLVAAVGGPAVGSPPDACTRRTRAEERLV